MKVIFVVLLIVAVATALPAQRRLRYKYARQGTESADVSRQSAGMEFKILQFWVQNN